MQEDAGLRTGERETRRRFRRRMSRTISRTRWSALPVGVELCEVFILRAVRLGHRHKHLETQRPRKGFLVRLDSSLVRLVRNLWVVFLTWTLHAHMETEDQRRSPAVGHSLSCLPEGCASPAENHEAYAGAIPPAPPQLGVLSRRAPDSRMTTIRSRIRGWASGLALDQHCDPGLGARRGAAPFAFQHPLDERGPVAALIQGQTARSRRGIIGQAHRHQVLSLYVQSWQSPHCAHSSSTVPSIIGGSGLGCPRARARSG